MSRLIQGKPIAMYSDEELLALLDRIVCIGNIDPMFCALAEASARALRNSSVAVATERKL